MKEFILGGCLAVWIFLIGLSTLDTIFSYLIIIFPILVLAVTYNIYLLKRVINKKIRTARTVRTKTV